MIKKLFLTAIFLCFCFVGFSQNTPKQMAKKITNKMAKVLSLDEVQKEEDLLSKAIENCVEIDKKAGIEPNLD